MQAINDITEFIFVRHEVDQVDMLFIPGGSYAELGEQAAWQWHAV